MLQFRTAERSDIYSGIIGQEIDRLEDKAITFEAIDESTANDRKYGKALVGMRKGHKDMQV
jgi:hypothetical protein